MFAKLKYLPLSRSPWGVSVHTRFGWKTLNVTYRHVGKPLQIVLCLNALSAATPSQAQASASTACSSPTKGGKQLPMPEAVYHD